MMVLKKSKAIKSLSKETGIIHKSLSYLARTSVNKPLIVIFLFGSFLLLSGGGIYYLQVNSNSENFLPPSHPFRQATDITNNDFGGTKYLTVLFEGDIKNPDLYNP